MFLVFSIFLVCFQGNRTLSWKPHLGAVNLDITIKDRTVNLTVTPIHATIICHFETKPEWTIDELSQVMHVPPTVLRRRIAFWQSQVRFLRSFCKNCILISLYLIDFGECTFLKGE